MTQKSKPADRGQAGGGQRRDARAFHSSILSQSAEGRKAPTDEVPQDLADIRDRAWAALDGGDPWLFEALASEYRTGYQAWRHRQDNPQPPTLPNRRTWSEYERQCDLERRLADIQRAIAEREREADEIDRRIDAYMWGDV